MSSVAKSTIWSIVLPSLAAALLLGCSGAASSDSSAVNASTALAPSQIRCVGSKIDLTTALISQRCGEAGVTEEVWSFESVAAASGEVIDYGSATFFCDEDKKWATLLSDYTGNRLRLDARSNGTYNLSQVGFYIDTLRCSARF